MNDAPVAAPPDVIHLSPTPPDRSGVADQAAMIVPALQAIARVEAWRRADQAAGALAAIQAPAPLQALKALNRARCPIYHIGNHGGFHSWILNLALQVPGVAILHDLDLRDLLLNAWGPQRFRAAIATDYGAQAADALCPNGAPPTPRRLRAFDGRHVGLRIIAEASLAIVVHSAFARSVVEAMTDAPVVVTPLAFALNADAPPPAPPLKPPLRIVAFDHATMDRGLFELLSAMAAVGDGGAFTLDVIGESPHWPRFWRRVRELGLGLGPPGRCVRHAGPLSLPETESLLRQADLAYNVRPRTLGESSGALLDVWASGRACIVADADAFADLPRDCVLHLPVRDGRLNPDDLKRLLQTIADAPNQLRRIGATAFERLRDRRSPARYAETLAALSANAPALKRAFALRRFAARIDGLAAAAGVSPELTPALLGRLGERLPALLAAPPMRNL